MIKTSSIFYSGVSVLTFLYVCFVSGLYTEWVLLDQFAVPADASVVFETKVRLGVSQDTFLTDDQIAELLSNKVEKQRNLAVFAIFWGTFFSLAAISAIAILVNK